MVLLEIVRHLIFAYRNDALFNIFFNVVQVVQVVIGRSQI